MLRKNLYSQKFKVKPIKPSYLLQNKTRIAVIKIMKNYSEDNCYNEDGFYTGINSIEYFLKNEILENYRWEVLPEVALMNNGKREATMIEFLRYESLSTKTRFLDSVQIYIDHSINKENYIQEINNLFEIDNFGYRIINNEIIKIGSQENFVESQKAFLAISELNLDNAKIELQESMTCYYSGNKPLAIKKAADSIETVLKYIITKDDGIIDKEIKNKKGQMKSLIDRVRDSGYFNCPYNIPIHNSIEHIIAPLRNKTPGAGHSKGIEKEKEIDDEIIELVIGLASSYISFLIKRFFKRQI